MMPLALGGWSWDDALTHFCSLGDGADVLCARFQPEDSFLCFKLQVNAIKSQLAKLTSVPTNQKLLTKSALVDW